MLLGLGVALLAGVFSGVFTGLAPGIHINLVATLLLANLNRFQTLPPQILIVFIVSMSITHTFIDFIPSIFLGAPEEGTFLSVLPGHQLMQQGLGHQAVVLTLYGSLLAIPSLLIISITYIIFLPSFFQLIKTAMPYILIFISTYLIFRDKRIFPAFLVFILSGSLGIIAFNTPVKEPLLPLLSGLFGISSLFRSLKSKTKLPKQIIQPLRQIKLPKHEFSRAFLASFISAPFCSFLPGVGSGHAAVLGSELFKQSTRGFLFLVGSLNTLVMGLSFITLFAINKSRTGSAAAIQNLLPKLTIETLFIIILTIIISSSLAFLIGVQLSKLASKFINFIPYNRLNLAVILLVLTINLFMSNWLGILVLTFSTLIGIYCISSGSRRINMMGSLILPSITYYLIN